MTWATQHIIFHHTFFTNVYSTYFGLEYANESRLIKKVLYFTLHKAFFSNSKSQKDFEKKNSRCYKNEFRFIMFAFHFFIIIVNSS